MLSCDFKDFLIFFGTFAHIVAQTWFVLQETWHTTLFSIHYCVKVVRIVNVNHMLEITCFVSILRIFKRFGTFAHKVALTWFPLHETWHTIIWYIFLQ